MIGRYLALLLGGVLVLAVLLRLTVVSTFVMSGGNMAPLILPGEYLLATHGNLINVPRGATVVMGCPGGTCLARVRAVAGDHVDRSDAGLTINGTVVDPPLTSPGSIQVPLVIPPEHVFLTNERDDDVDDSRARGPIPTAALEARVRLIWLSLDWFTEAGEVRDVPRVRWDRVFSRVE